MKRFLAFAAMMIAMILCTISCDVPLKTTSSRKNGLNCSFSAKAEITLDRLNAEGNIKRFGTGAWEIEFSSPDSLSGVKLDFSEGNVSASYKGLSFSIPQSALPVKAMMLNLIKAVDDSAALDELKGEEKDNSLVIKGKLESGDYTLSVDKDGHLSGFVMDGFSLNIKLSEFAVIEETTVPVTTAAAETETTTAPVTSKTATTTKK